MNITNTSLKKDYILTFATQFVILASVFIVYRLVADFLGKDGFAEYALSRRTVSLIHPAIFMGLSVGIPRYISSARANRNNSSPDIYFVGGICILFPVALFFLLFLNLFGRDLAFILFGDAKYFYLVFPITIMVAGLILHAVCYSYFRGRFMMGRANLLQLINEGLVPPLVICLFKKTLISVLIVTGTVWIIISCAALVYIFFILEIKEWDKLASSTKEVVGYGIMRVPGDFAFAALLMLPAVFTAHIAGAQAAGFVAFGTVVLNMVGYSFAPLGIILLPRASYLVACDDYQSLKHGLMKMVKSVVLLAVIIMLALEVFSHRLIELYLKNDFLETVNIVRIISLGIIPHTLYIVLRNIVDAYYVRPVNAMNLIVSLVFFTAVAMMILFFQINYLYIVWGFAVTIGLLGALSVWAVKNVFEKNVAIKDSGI